MSYADRSGQSPQGNVPNLRFPEFSGEWEKHALTEYLEFKNGLNTDSKRFGKGVKFISVMDILNNQYITYDKIISSVDVNDKELETYKVNYGDILFQRSSETFEDIGMANVYLDREPAVFGGFVIRGKKIGDYSPLFFRYLLLTPFARRSIIVKGAGAQHFNIGQDGLSKVSLYFPSKIEQNKIANLFRLLDERISTQIKIIEDLKKLKGAITHLHFDVTFSKFQSTQIDKCITQISNKNKDGNVTNVLSVSNKNGFVNQSEQFEDREIASEDTTNYKVVNVNDFAYNPARINVGSIARLHTFTKGIVSPMYVCFHTKPLLLAEYFEHFFYTTYFKHEMHKRLEGSVRLCLTYENLCNIKIALPTTEEQKQFVQQISEIISKIDNEERILSMYQSQKQYLLTQMFI